MASNIIQRTIPYIWSSANDDVIFEFDFKPYLINGVQDDGNGDLEVTLFSALDVSPVVGEKIFVNAPNYSGTYTIKSILSNIVFVLDTPFTTPIDVDTYDLFHLRIPIFNFYKGFDTGEFAPSDLPIELVVPIVPSIIYDGNVIPYISINVKAITSRMFKPQPFTPTGVLLGTNIIDYNLFNVIRFRWDDQETEAFGGYNYVRILYSAITNNELRLEYLQNGKYLVPTENPIIPTSGTAWFSYMELYIIGAFVINPGYPVVHKFVDGVRVFI